MGNGDLHFAGFSSAIRSFPQLVCGKESPVPPHSELAIASAGGSAILLSEDSGACLQHVRGIISYGRYFGYLSRRKTKKKQETCHNPHIGLIQSIELFKLINCKFLRRGKRHHSDILSAYHTETYLHTERKLFQGKLLLHSSSHHK